MHLSDNQTTLRHLWGPNVRPAWDFVTYWNPSSYHQSVATKVDLTLYNKLVISWVRAPAGSPKQNNEILKPVGLGIFLLTIGIAYVRNPMGN